MTGSPQDPPQPMLIVTGGPRDGSSLSINTPGFEKLLGSGADCHFRLDAGNVDFHHATVLWDDRGLLITDLASGTGTYVNGERVGSDHVLQDGDRVCLGPPGSKQTVKLLARVPADLAANAPFVMATDSEPLVLEEPSAPTAPSRPGGQPSFSSGAPASGTTAPPAGSGDDVFVVPVEPAPPPPAAPRPPSPPPAPSAATEIPPPLRPPSRPSRGDYSEVPSIPSLSAAAERTEVPSAVPPLPERRPRPPSAGKAAPRVSLPSLPAVPSVVWIAVGVAVLGGLGFLGWSMLRKPVPVLALLSASKAEPGGPLTLSGTGFETTAANDVVRFGDTTAEVVSATATQLTVTVPAGLAPSGPTDVPVTVETRGGRSNPMTVKVRRIPHGTRLEPDVALPGAEVTLVGRALDMKPLSVTVAGLPAEVRPLAADRLRFVVPTALPFEEGRNVAVLVVSGLDSAPPLKLFLGRLPLVAEMVPPRGLAGERVILKGRGFDANPAGNKVTFAGETAFVLGASDSELTVVAPLISSGSGAVSVPVVVEAKGTASSGAALFSALRPSASIYVPRFFAAQVEDDRGRQHAFVSTELGPVFLLSSRDEAPTVGDRAVQVANALNDRFGAASLPLEVRDSPLPSVVSGGTVLVRATAEDAAGYAPPWAPSMKTQRTTPRALANHWTLLLQDLHSLCVERQRPVKVVEVSPRGKVLLELYADSVRLTGAGVPTSLVNPVPFAVARAFRDMALTLPSQGGQATAAAAVTGTWEGTIVEQGAPERGVRLALRIEGTRLAGVLRTEMGAVAMEVPIDQAAFDKGVLTFGLTRGGESRRFRAALQGATMNGTIEAPGKGQVGLFTLRYVE